MDNKNYKCDVEFTLWDRLTLPYWRLVGIIENWIFEIKMAYQRVVRGYDDTAIWNFEEYVAQQIKEVCFRIAEDGHGYPNHLTEKKWKQILLDISFGFGSYIEMRSGIYEVKSKEFKSLQKDYKKGLKLFADNHQYLWD